MNNQTRSQQETKKPIYKRTWFIIVAVLFVFTVIGCMSDDSTTTTQKAAERPIAKNKNTEKENTKKDQEVTKEKEVEPIEVDVTSQIVKNVNGKYRYFFDIRNNDSKDFNGTIIVKLYNTDDLMLGIESFDANTPLKPEMGNSVYIDANSGPTSIHGSSGITKFKYDVKIDNVITKSEEGLITEKFENLSL